MVSKKENDKGRKQRTSGIIINPLYANIAVTLILAAVTLWLLAIDNANYLRKIESLSLFVSTQDYYIECMRLPGGFLTWASAFMTQTFYYPWFGAVIYALLLVCIAVAAYKAFRLPKRAYAAALIIPAAALLSVLNLGYVIFSLKSPGYAFLLPIGSLCSILVFWGYRSIKLWWLRLAAVCVIAVWGYAAAGFYALLIAGMCVVYEVVSAISTPKVWWQHLLIIAVASLSVWLVPEYWVMHVDTDVSIYNIYRCPLPRFIDGEDSLYTPYIIVAITLGLLSAVAAIPRRRPEWGGTSVTVCSAVVGVCSLIYVAANRYDDSNFRLTLDLDRALWEQQWQQAVDRMAAFADDPTRLNVILSDMALLRSGSIGDRMFTLPIGSAEYATERWLRATHDAGSMMFSYHTGLINYAYRWAMEYKVEYGMNVEQLKFMTKCALLNGDYAVAAKCLDTLGKTAFHRDWADKYSTYLHDPALIDSDPEMRDIRATVTHNNVFIEDGGQLEGYVWSHLATLRTDNPDVLELSLAGALVCRKIDDFAELLPHYASRHDRLPRHFQEGILIWSRAHNNTLFRQYRIDQEVKEQFKSFLVTQEQYSGMTLEEQAQRMRPMFGNTYWYYVLYMRNLKVI